jgi:hypothetical protein
LSDPRLGVETNVAVEEGNTSSDEEEVIVLAEAVYDPDPDQSQPSLSVNDISADLTEEEAVVENEQNEAAVEHARSQGTTGDPEIGEIGLQTETVSFTLDLNHLCAARMYPMSVLSVVY